jgi:hypothetical protein
MTVQERLTKIWMKIPKPYPALAKLAANYDSRWKKGAEILYLGDSVVERISWHDTDKRTLDRMVADGLSDGKKLLCIAQAAYHFRLYFHLLEVLRSMRNKPELVILPLNMRCFSPQWDLNPAWQFEEEIQALREYPITKRIPAIRGNADALIYSETERNLALDLPFTELKHLGQFLDIIKNIPSDPEGKFHRRKQIYILHYLNTLNRNHRRFEYLGKILDLLNELKVRALLYITPINYEGGVRHVGNGFIKIIRSNAAVVRDFICPYLENGWVRFLDLQEYLPSDDFFHADELTEHLNQSGRMKLAQALVHEIEKG